MRHLTGGMDLTIPFQAMEDIVEVDTIMHLKEQRTHTKVIKNYINHMSLVSYCLAHCSF